jgi:hypothetical protein
VKANLYRHLFGNDGDGKYNITALFEEQVTNEELKTWAWYAGQYAFNCYRTWGCYDELLCELEKSEEDPQFERKVKGEIEGVPVVGYLDMWYKRIVQVILDWKVMGFCSASAQSPKKFYKSCRDCWGVERAKATRGGGGEPKAHKNYDEIEHHSHLIGSHFLEDADKKWADQIAIYALLLDGGEDTVACIDQLCCKPSENKHEPLIRVAQHRCRVSAAHQASIIKRLTDAWDIIQSGHIFDDLSREQSDSRCELLDVSSPDVGHNDFWAACDERKWF